MPEVVPPTSITEIDFELGYSAGGLLSATNGVLPMDVKKNTAFSGFTFSVINKVSGAAITSGVTAYRIKDGGSQSSSDNTPAHKGNGQWSIDFTANDLNADVIGFMFVHTDAVPYNVTLHTTTKPSAELQDISEAGVAAALTSYGASTATNVTDAASTLGAAVSGVPAAVWGNSARTLTAIDATIISGNISGTVGGLASITFPTNFSTLAINSSGHIEHVVLCDTNTDMRGTNSALLATGVPTNFSSLAINASGYVEHVVLCDTTTTNTDMRGTDSAALPSDVSAATGSILSGLSTVQDDVVLAIDGVPDAVWAVTTRTLTAINATIISGNISGTVGGINGITFPSNFSSLAINASGHIERIVLCDTTTTNTDMRGTDSALLATGVPANFSILSIDGTGKVSSSDSDKTGYKLAADGLDAITATLPTTVATTLPEMVVQTWSRFFKKATMTETEIKTFAADGTTVITTQVISEDGTTQTQGAAA